jgi:hypothetical protein
MPASAASALQQGIGKPLLLGPARSHPLQRLFTNLTPDGVLRVAGFAFCYDSPVVDGPLVYCVGYFYFMFATGISVSPDHNNQIPKVIM